MLKIMATYNKQDAEELLRELQELLKPYPERIKEVSNNGPIIDIICEGLGKANLCASDYGIAT